MATFVLIHGAGDDSWYWHLLVPRLESAGHTVVAPDLPCEDDAAGLAEYADVVVVAVEAAEATGSIERPLVVVAQSLGGLTAPLVADRIPVDQLVLLAAMVPLPGEPPGELWGNTGLADDRRALYERLGLPTEGDMDLARDFFHDADPELRAEIMARPEIDQSGTPFADPWPGDAWPDVPTRFLAPVEDRMFPLTYQRRVVRDRLGHLGVEVEEVPGAHCAALTEPEALAAALLSGPLTGSDG